MKKQAKETPEWLEYVKNNVRADFEKGEIYWLIPMKGRRMKKPIGCPDKNGYIKAQINHVSTYVHRVIWILAYGYIPKMLDHKSRKTNENWLTNLEETNHSKNALNSKIWSTNTTGVKGVSITPYNRFKVTKCGKYLGNFIDLWRATDAYNKN